MEEKKLNDEEIIDCLYECEKLRGCNGCKLKNSQECGDLIIGAIKRLQSKIAEYEQKLEDGELVSKDSHDEQVGHAELVIEEQNAEIERLTSLYDGKSGFMTSNIGDLPLTVEGLRKAIDEISRLLVVQTELQELNAKYYNEAKDLRRENTELQKQVDELTKKNIDLHLDKQELMNEISEHKNAYARLNEAYVNLNNLYQQAVKDTVKEIYDLMMGEFEDYIPTDIAKEIVERCGVEVE